MVGNFAKIDNFTDLNVWKEGHSLVILVYKVTKKFPKEEVYCLTDQMRRAAISITSNVAEGFGRHTYKEKTQFYYQSLGFLDELENQILIGKDIGYFSDEDYNTLVMKVDNVRRLLKAFIRKTKSFIR